MGAVEPDLPALRRSVSARCSAAAAVKSVRRGVTARRAAPALAATTSPIATISRAPSTSPSTTRPARARHGGLQAHEHAEHVGRQPPQRLQLQRVRDGGGEHGHGQADRQHLRLQAGRPPASATPTGRSSALAITIASVRPGAAGQGLPNARGDQDVGGPERARREREHHAEGVGVAAAAGRPAEGCRPRRARPTAGPARAASPPPPRPADRRTRASRPRPAAAGPEPRRRRSSCPPARPRRPTMSAHSRRTRPRSGGRQMAASTSAPKSMRSITVPPGPASSKSVLASDAPTCTDATAPSTSTVGGTPRAALASIIAATLPAWDDRDRGRHGHRSGAAGARRAPAATRSSSASSPRWMRRSP